MECRFKRFLSFTYRHLNCCLLNVDFLVVEAWWVLEFLPQNPMVTAHHRPLSNTNQLTEMEDAANESINIVKWWLNYFTISCICCMYFHLFRVFPSLFQLGNTLSITIMSGQSHCSIQNSYMDLIEKDVWLNEILKNNIFVFCLLHRSSIAFSGSRNMARLLLEGQDHVFISFGRRFRLDGPRNCGRSDQPSSSGLCCLSEWQQL